MRILDSYELNHVTGGISNILAGTGIGFAGGATVGAVIGAAHSFLGSIIGTIVGAITGSTSGFLYALICAPDIPLP